MTELAALAPGARVLEIGTGSGYQAAVLAEMGADVYTIEILAGLARSAAARLARLGYARVHTRTGDGWRGWPEAAPFDAILITAATRAVPPPLAAQLALGGRLVLPLGSDEEQELVVVTRTAAGLVTRHVAPVLFVPMTGEAGKAGPRPPPASTPAR
jgi:protein-L-isoaspartate(D-aspartate) O-methyltransferase